MEEISKDKLWAIYETLPDNLKDAIFSEETSDAIWNICKLHEVKRISDVAKIVGRVLMGLLPPKMLIETLQDELALEEDIAKKIGMEIEHFVFNAVKNELDALYEENGNIKEKTVKTEGEKIKSEEKSNDQEESDVYREIV